MIRVRALALPSMFPTGLREALAGLPFSVACIVAPPEAVSAEHGAVALGQTLVLVNGQRMGLIPSESPDVTGAVFGLLRASLSPWLAPPHQERSDAWFDDEKGDPFEVLGVAPSDSFEKVRAAWRARLAEYHPDRYAQAGIKIRAVAADESRRLNAAFAAIAAQRGNRLLPTV